MEKCSISELIDNYLFPINMFEKIEWTDLIDRSTEMTSRPSA